MATASERRCLMPAAELQFPDRVGSELELFDEALDTPLRLRRRNVKQPCVQVEILTNGQFAIERK